MTPTITTERATAAEHYAIQTSHTPRTGTQNPRSKASHLCIVICGSGSASGLPATGAPRC